MPNNTGLTPEQRFMRAIRVNPMTGCWEWTRSLHKGGYGQFRDPAYPGVFSAHRWAYVHFVGPVPDGLELDHLCRNRPCANPDHLDPVTHAENMRRAGRGARGENMKALAAASTHCRAGHPRTEENTVYRSGARHCRVCDRAAWRRAYYVKRDKARALRAANRSTADTRAQQ